MKKIVLILSLIVFSQLTYAQFSKLLPVSTPMGTQDYPNTYRVFNLDTSFITVVASGHRLLVNKVDLNGNIVKDLILPCNAYYGFSSKQFSDGIYLVSSVEDTAGKFNGFVAKINGNLDTLWTKTFDGSFLSSYLSGLLVPPQLSFSEIAQTPDNGFLLTGGYLVGTPYPIHHAFMVKVNANFQIQWFKDFQFSQPVHQLLLTPDLGILVLTGNKQNAIIKMNALGQNQWSHSVSISEYPFVSDIQFSDSNTYIFILLNIYAYDNNNREKINFKVRRIKSSNGAVLWDKSYWPSSSICDNQRQFLLEPLMLRELQNGDIMVFGSDAYLQYYDTSLHNTGIISFPWSMRLNSFGDSIFLKLYYDNFNLAFSRKTFALYDVQLNSQNDSLTGFGLFYSETHMGYDSIAFWLFSRDTHNFTAVNPIAESSYDVQLYPNPCSSYCILSRVNPIGETVQIEVYDLQGKLRDTYSSKKQNLRIPVAHLSEGVYLVIVKSAIGVFAKKILVSR